MNLFLKLSIIGAVVGILYGIYGVAAALFLIVGLVAIGYSVKEATGSSLMIAIVPFTIFGTYVYYKAGYVKVKETLWLAVFITLGSILGAWLNTQKYKCMNEKNMSISFGICSIILGLFMIFMKKK